METINWGIIGVGDVCEKKSGPAFYKIENSSLVAVMRRDGVRLKDYAERHSVGKYYTNADELIADPEVNAIYVATPPHLHKEYAIKGMKAGKPVYVEKPMAMNYQECLDMIRVSEETNQKLFVAYYRRSLPYFLKVKSLLDGQAIGKVVTVNVRHYKEVQNTDLQQDDHTWRIDKAIGGDGYFYDLAPHTLDILDFLLGEIEGAQGFTESLGGYYDVTDTISAILKFKSGVLGSAQWCFVTSKYAVEDVVEIIGDKGKIIFSIFAFTPIQLNTDFGIQTYTIDSPEHIQQPLIESIVAELLQKGESPSTGISGARTSNVIDWIMNS